MRQDSSRTKPFHLSRDLDKRLRTEFLTLVENDETFKGRYLKSEIFSKFVGFETDAASLRRQRAIDKWRATELRNARTNVRIFCGETNFGFTTSERLLNLARVHILQLLGVAPPSDVFFGTYSNGASTSKRRGVGLVARKFAEKGDVTPECFNIIKQMLNECEVWKTLNIDLAVPNFVKGNVLFTVPKTSTIDRVAAKEPDLNMFAQKGVGDYIRTRLRSIGIDLNDQTRNQRLALVGSSNGSLATVDLSSASDSVTTALVCRLLPTEWFHLLNQIRSRATFVDGVWHTNEMFSSMGNGFTFELESLIFWALVKALMGITRTRGSLSVYGDDIICPSSLRHPLTNVLGFCGFLLNKKKSHFTGTFRESCGKHYCSGKDVTPFYIKEPVLNQQRLIHFLNSLRKWSECGTTGICDPRYEHFFYKYARHVDRRFHGGYDMSGIEALVSLSPPRYRLAYRVRDCGSGFDTGNYLQWLRAALSRPIRSEYVLSPSFTSHIVTSTVEKETSELIIRRLRKDPFGTKFPLWLQGECYVST
ncbi:TPA_asm: RNA-directed RNA polymerase [ssRNA phage SRR5466729_1]|uniref:RNA-directed RNA polymerase n=1 Tax=ssRNA phage SRR5466729_1 TaxID=2786444 RepID=A0A8S5L0L7_9VIRU|nr:RNA-directed RNA polymerase [ssRNA phage SRR5466729_1]DAD50869.1 TPA_asm: RNA-directed RNA polymerase [ssRNA phage SRR5466729_1]